MRFCDEMGLSPLWLPMFDAIHNDNLERHSKELLIILYSGECQEMPQMICPAAA